MPEVSQSPLNIPQPMPAWCGSGEGHFPVSCRHDFELDLHFHGARLRLDLHSTSNSWLPPLSCPVNHFFTRSSWSISLIHHLPEHKQTNHSFGVCFWGTQPKTALLTQHKMRIFCMFSIKYVLPDPLSSRTSLTSLKSRWNIMIKGKIGALREKS